MSKSLLRARAGRTLFIVTILSANAPTLAADQPDAGDSVAGEQIVVTGNRSRPRTVLESPAPIDVLSGDQLARTGRATLRQALNDLVPSFWVANMGSGTSAAVRVYTLRGLQGDQVLFLVNGKRRHQTALINNLARTGNGSVPTDIDLIPVSAISRIEILRDGAAAQYGSDAIAGVVNIILKGDEQGGQISATAGQNYEGDGETFDANMNYGARLGDAGGFVQIALAAKRTERAARGLPATIANFYPLLPGGQRDPREATANRLLASEVYGNGEDAILSGAVNIEIPLGAATAYSFSTLSYRNALKQTGAVFPFNANALPDVAPDGFATFRRILELDFQTVAGIRGNSGAWRWDISSSFARDNAKLNGENILNASLGPDSPRKMNLTRHIFDQWTTNLDVGRDFDIGLHGPLSLSLGAEYRYERFSIRAGQPEAYTYGTYVIPSGPFAGQRPDPGLGSFNGTSPAEAGTIKRNNAGAYIELSADIMRGWYLGFAGRFEHYDDSAGNSWAGKVATRYEFAPGFAIRGALSNGFRAPSLAQTIFASSTVSGTRLGTGEVVLIPVKVLPVSTPEAKVLGATPLKPEKSVNLAIGVTAEPLAGLKLSVDAYRIDIDDRIVQTGFLRGPIVSALLQAAGFAPGLAAQYYTNAIDTRTRGVDIVGEYGFGLGAAGRLTLNAAYTYNKTSIRGIRDNPPALAQIGVLFDRQKQGDITDNVPRNKVVLGADWRLDGLSINLREVYYGPYTEKGLSQAIDLRFGSKWLTDVNVTYDVTPSTTIGVGASNLFDVHPDPVGAVNTSYGSGLYGSNPPFAITGGYYYARLSRRF